MGTNLYVGIVRDDRSIDCIWVRYNGDPSASGSILYFEFQDIEDIEYLISRGNLSALSKRYSQWKQQDEIIANAETIEDNGCGVDVDKYGPYKIENKDMLIAKAGVDFAEYLYLYEDKRWIVYHVGIDTWHELGDFIEWHFGRVCSVCGKRESEHHEFESDEEPRWFSTWAKEEEDE
jgi:hypothetical protein